MSRVGKSPIALSKDVKASLKDGVLTVQGPKATLERVIHPAVIVEIDSEVINVRRIDESIETRSLHGLFRMLVSNMVTGVTKGFTKVLEV
ncbi:MAG TPA: 50S ribosomal protein L6, partial [bacterium]|nr:50S ribosomal protein L6 [bacterium]